jgi:hypothetical protein
VVLCRRVLSELSQCLPYLHQLSQLHASNNTHHMLHPHALTMEHSSHTCPRPAARSSDDNKLPNWSRNTAGGQAAVIPVANGAGRAPSAQRLQQGGAGPVRINAAAPGECMATYPEVWSKPVRQDQRRAATTRLLLYLWQVDGPDTPYPIAPGDGQSQTPIPPSVNIPTACAGNARGGGGSAPGAGAGYEKPWRANMAGAKGQGGGVAARQGG